VRLLHDPSPSYRGKRPCPLTSTRGSGSRDGPCSQEEGPGSPGLSSSALAELACERLRLELVELGLADRTGVEELLALGDLIRAGVGRGDRADVVVRLRLRCLRPRRGALPHALAVGDQVDEDAKVGQDDDEDAPGGLRPAADVVPAEHVAEHHDEQPEPDDEREDDQHVPQEAGEVVVGENQYALLARVRGVFMTTDW